MPWFGRPRPQPHAYVSEHPGPKPWVPVPSARDNLPYQVWLTSTKDFTLARVSQQTYGLASLWPKIAAANPRVDPFALQAGMHLIIPRHEPAEKPQQRARTNRRRIQAW